jgi:hypothetical protein
MKTNLTPKDFANIFPLRSIIGKAEAETVAQHIMIILARTGNEWRKKGMEWNEYERECKKDGHSTDYEQPYFERVVIHTHSSIMAGMFSTAWKF